MDKQKLIMKEYQNVNLEKKIHLYLKFPELRRHFMEMELNDTKNKSKSEK